MSLHNTLDEQTTQPEFPESYRIAGGIVVALLLLIGIGVSIGGEVGRFIEAGIQYSVFIPLALLGILGLHALWARIASYIYALWIHAGVMLFTVSLALMSRSDGPIDWQNPQWLPGTSVLMGSLMLTLVMLLLLCSAVLLRPVRNVLARWLPIDPDNLTHTLALWVILFMTASGFAQLAFLGGQPALLTAISSDAIPSDELAERSAIGQKLDLVYGLLWIIPLVLISAGWPLTRRLGEALQRLGLVRPNWKQILFALLAAAALVVCIRLTSYGLSAIWQWFGWSETDADAFVQLLGTNFSPIGALLIGITAGLGEELAVRGLLQPRLGILLSNLAFTSFHVYQYGPDALIIVFLLGSVLGIIRARSNTTTAAIVHGTYNTLTILVPLLGF